MSGMPYPAADNQGSLARSNTGDTRTALTFFAILAMLTMILAGVVRIPSPIGCSLDDRLALLHSGGEASAVSRRGAPCLITPLRSDWNVKALEVVAPPINGKVSMRGATGLYYVPNAQFKGRDSFTFRVVRRTDTGTPAITHIVMKIDVD